MKILGYIGFGILSILVCLYLTFPADVMGQRLSHELRKQTKGKVNLSFDVFDLDGLNGIEAEGVDVRMGDQDPIRVDSLSTHVQWLSLLTFNPAIEAEIGLGDGRVDLEVAPQGAGMDIAVEIDQLNLEHPPIVGKYAGLPIRGVITGGIDSGWKDSIRTLAGEGTLSLKKVSVGPGSVAGITIPAISLGDIEIELVADKGVIEIKSYKQSGGDFQTKISGGVELRSRMIVSSFKNFCIEFKGDPTFLNKNGKLKSAIEIATIQLKKDARNFLHVPLSGTVGRLRLKKGLCSKGTSKKSGRR